MSTQFIVMGVSGSGKSSVGRVLSQRWDVPFVEGDELHGPENVAKMAAGVPLDDADRAPWLDRIGQSMLDASAKGRGAVISCSALRKSYRDRLRAIAGPNLRFAMLELGREALEFRMSLREGHYMPTSLLDSQLNALEHPTGEADVLIVDADGPLEGIADQVCQWRVELLVTGETW